MFATIFTLGGRKPILLAAMLALCGHALSLRAETVTEDFISATGSSFALTGLPQGWSVIGSLSDFERETDKYHSARPAIAANGNGSYLVTPMLAGEVSFWLRNYTKNYSASITFFACTGDDDQLTVGEQVAGPFTIAKGGTTWTPFSFTVGSAMRLAVLMTSGVLDDFTYTTAADADGGLGITAFATTTPSVTTDMEGAFMATFTATLQNYGTTALTAADGATVSLLDDQSNVVATSAPLEVDAGASASVTLTYMGRTNSDAQLTFYARIDPGQTLFATPATVSVQVFGPRFAIDATEGEPQDYGFLEKGGEAVKTFTITNSGNYPLTVAATAPDGFQTSDITVAAGQTGTLVVSMDTSTPGLKSGTLELSLNATGTASFSMPLTGYVADPDKLYVTFDDNQLPDKWVQGACAWSFADGEARGTYSVNSRTNSEMTTPLLTVGDDEAMVFLVRSTGSFPEFSVWYSSDNGATWTRQQSYDDDVTSTWQLLTLSGLAAGDYLLKFEGYNVAIDVINGFTLKKTVTAVSDVTAKQTARQQVSNLQGQRVTQLRRGHLYLIDGKKVVAKNR